MNNNHEVQEAQAIARATASKIASVLPKRLVEKENNLLQWYKRLKGNPRTKLLALYEFMAELYHPVLSLTPCKKGCASCCHIPVSVSRLEIEVIQRGAGKRPRQIFEEPSAILGHPCPFLANGSCEIYAHRPFVCRRHIMLTKTDYWCHPDRCMTISLDQPRFSEVEKVFQIIIAERGQAEPVDIRQVFGKR